MVTEIRTPTRAPDLAEVSERIPATPAKTAMITENSFGREMNWVNGWFPAVGSPGPMLIRLVKSANRKAAVIAAGNPTRSALAERIATSLRLAISATQKPAIGPNSGPTTIAPMIRIVESRMIPHAAISPAITISVMKFQFSSVLSVVRDATCSQITASPGIPSAACSALSPASEISTSTASIAIDPSRSTPRSFRSPSTMLASSRATSQRIRSPSGCLAAPGR